MGSCSGCQGAVVALARPKGGRHNEQESEEEDDSAASTEGAEDGVEAPWEELSHSDSGECMLQNLGLARSPVWWPYVTPMLGFQGFSAHQS